jgi:hypothetical protein
MLSATFFSNTKSQVTEVKSRVGAVALHTVLWSVVAK